MLKEKFPKFEKIEFSKKTKKITVTAVITFLVFAFFIWLGIGMYVSVPQESRGELWPMFLMYLVFPAIIFILGVRRVHSIINGEESDDDDDDDDEPENDDETE